MTFRGGGGRGSIDLQLQPLQRPPPVTFKKGFNTAPVITSCWSQPENQTTSLLHLRQVTTTPPRQIMQHRKQAVRPFINTVVADLLSVRSAKRLTEKCHTLRAREWC